MLNVKKEIKDDIITFRLPTALKKKLPTSYEEDGKVKFENGRYVGKIFRELVRFYVEDKENLEDGVFELTKWVKGETVDLKKIKRLTEIIEFPKELKEFLNSK